MKAEITKNANLLTNGFVKTSGSDGTLSVDTTAYMSAIGSSIGSATEGSVLFAGVAGILAQDNSNFFWNDTNNRFGINTAATPLAAFDVRSAVTGVAVEAIQEPSSTSNINTNIILSGFSFSVSTRSVVSRLGRYWYSGNTANFVVKIYDNAGTVLASGTVLNSATTEANGYKYVSITPITLTADQIYIIGIDETTGQNHQDEWTPTAVSPLIDIKYSKYGFGSYPNNDQNPKMSYSAPNMTIAPEYASQISSGYSATKRFESFTDMNGNTSLVSNPYGAAFSFNSPLGVGIGIPRTGKIFEVLGESYFSGQRPIQAKSANGDVISFGVGSTNVTEAAISATNGYLLIDTSTTNDLGFNYYKSSRNVNITTLFGSGYKFGVGIDSASKVGEVIRGATSQTADLVQWQDSTSAVLAHVKANGDFETVGSVKIGPDSGKGIISYATNTLNFNTSGGTTASLDNGGLILGQPGQSYASTIALRNQGSGTNYAAGDLTFISGAGTGSGTAGSFLFQTADVTTSGTTPQALTTKVYILGNGNVGFRVATPTARIHLAAGTTVAGTAPIKLDTGTALTTSEDGALEYHTSHLYFTIGSTRYQLDQQGGGSGTVTSVGFTGGLISVATATTTPAFTVAGTSGGIPYFSSASTWATSSALAANAIVIGGGAGVAPSTVTTGTGIIAALGVNTGSAGAPVLFNGALGTPTSGIVTNLTGTASININGTVGATTPSTGSFTTVTTSGNIELGNASDTTLSRSAAGTLAVEGIRVRTTTPLIVSAASYTTDTGTSLNMDNLDQFVITAQAGALLFNSPGGTLVQGRSLVIRIKDNGTARALTWNAVFRAMGIALPSTTVLSKTLYLGFFYNTTDTKWDLVASAQEA